MPTNRQPDFHFHREIPNGQVVDAAKQFYDAYRLLAQQPLPGLLLPELHCAFIALELYLKALSADTLSVPDTDSGIGAYIHAKARVHKHDLGALFDLAMPEERRALDLAVRKRECLMEFRTARDALVLHNEVFLSSRYPFEVDSSFDAVQMGRLHALMEAVHEVVTGMPRRFVRQSRTNK